MKISLWEDHAPYAVQGREQDMPYLVPYIVEGSSSAIIICPGGGYHHLADHEGEPVASWLNHHGISAFVLHYRIAPHHEPAPQMDSRQAIRYVRANAEKFGVDPSRIGILGFSAGGHVAAMAGTAFDSGNPESDHLVERTSSRPDLMVLCYPVITMKSFGHSGSRENLIGPSPSELLVSQYSAETHVSSETPPAFIWHTANDSAVSVENSLQFALSLSSHSISYELHIFPEGRHGLGLAKDFPAVAQWSDLCMVWLKQQGW
ncbi:alpha/beta hydrolase [Paenibacillus crassostreae]|uniref:Esterase n=1 Tax=Paenibacillus crassostreae TaxID=1763538 RepID=A0A167FQ70_9BACL|nr:alpha/beta hydrolase [Paenibacillus crassostreae]AOZ94174.1 alpha/beta hydrolase [Paenibacillus crassostreae]OAB76790.1 esterase [Paenibacillus crassostreae]